MFKWILSFLALLKWVLSETGRDSAPIEITRHIYMSDTLYFDVDSMFPSLVSTPVFSGVTADGDLSTLSHEQQRLLESNLSNFKLSEPFINLISQNDTANYTCKGFLKFTPRRFGMACSETKKGPSVFRLMEIDFGESKTVSEIARVDLPFPSLEYSVLDVVGGKALFLLMRRGEGKYVLLLAIIGNNTISIKDSLDFDYHSMSGKMAMRLGKQKKEVMVEGGKRTLFHRILAYDDEGTEEVFFYSALGHQDHGLLGEGTYSSIGAQEGVGMRRVQGEFSHKTLFEMVPTSDGFIGLFMKDNHPGEPDLGDEVQYTLEMMDCWFNDDNDPIGMTCNYTQELGRACPRADHSVTRKKPRTDSYMDTSLEGNTGITYMYLVTDCQLSRFPLKTHEKGKTMILGVKSTNISIQVREELEIGVTKDNFYAIVPATFSNDSYLLTADKESTYARVLRNQKFNGEGYLYFLGTNVDGYVFDALLVSVYNPDQKAKQFQLYTMRRQKILISLDKDTPKQYEGKPLLVRASGETLDGTIIRYDFNISIQTSLENIGLQSARLPIIEVYPASSNPLYTTTFPLDYASLKANDPRLHVIGKVPWLKLESSRYKNIDRSLFHLNGKYFNGTGREVQPSNDNLIDGKYALFLYPDWLFSLFRCESSATSEFECENIIFNQTLNHTGRTAPTAVDDIILPTCFISILDKNNITHTVIITQQMRNDSVFSYFENHKIKGYFTLSASVKSCRLLQVDSNITFMGIFRKNEEPNELPFVVRAQWEVILETFSTFQERVLSLDKEHRIYGVNLDLVNAPILGFDTVGEREVSICQPMPGSPGSFFFVYADLTLAKESKTIHTAIVFDDTEKFYPIEIFKTKALLWIEPKELQDGTFTKPRLELFTFNKEYQERSINTFPDDFSEAEIKLGKFNIIYQSNQDGYFVLGIVSGIRVVLYTYDLRASFNHPLGRLKARHYYPLSPDSSFFSVVDIERSKIITMAFYTNGTTLAKESELGVIHTKLIIDKSKLPNVDSRVIVDINSYDRPEKNPIVMVVRAAEFDYSVTAKPSPFKMHLTDQDISRGVDTKRRLSFDIEDTLFISTHTTMLTLMRYGEYEDSLVSVTDRTLMYTSPAIVKYQQLSSAERDHFRRVLIHADEEVRYIGSKYLLINSPQAYSIYSFGEDRFNRLLIEDKREGKDPLSRIATNIIPPVEFNRNRKRTPSVGIVAAVIKGDLESLYDAELTAFNIDNPAQRCTVLVREISNHDLIKIERITRLNNIYHMSVQYSMRTRNGTMAYVNYFALIPTKTKESGDPLPIYEGFRTERLENWIEYPIALDVLTFGNFNALRPSPGTAGYFYFFPNSNQVGLFYLSSRATFKRYVFSSTCILRSDTRVSCKIFEQDMDIGCIVLCDQTRIEAFRLRVKVDDLEGGVKEELQGVDIIRGETYRLPVDYTVIDIVKGETLDFVLAQQGSEESILFFDSSTGLIFHKIEGSEICVVSPCLNSTYLTQLPNGRILIIPKNKSLENVVYHRRKPQISFSGEGLRGLSSLKGYALRIQGVGKDSYRDIDLDSLFMFREEDHTMEYVVGGTIFFFFLLGSCLLFLYKNYRADLENLHKYQGPEVAGHHKHNEANLSLVGNDSVNEGISPEIAALRGMRKETDLGHKDSRSQVFTVKAVPTK